MPEFTVDDDLAAIVWQLAKPKPFEVLTFSAALRRVLHAPTAFAATDGNLDEQGAMSAHPTYLTKAEPKKAPTPSPTEWVATVHELKGKRGLHTWKSICDMLKIDTAGDSARRKLKNWVKLHRPMWPAVPDID